jgi:hypothetical protein
MDSVRSHSPEPCVGLAFAARAGAATLAALVMACSSASGGSDAGTGGDTGMQAPVPDSGSDTSTGDASADDASDGSGLACTPIGDLCESFTVCCAGGTCQPAGPGGSACTGVDSGPGDCLLAGEPCSATESCCTGSSNCGEGTTNTCE